MRLTASPEIATNNDRAGQTATAVESKAEGQGIDDPHARPE